jgi:hypothetical protein
LTEDVNPDVKPGSEIKFPPPKCIMHFEITMNVRDEVKAIIAKGLTISGRPFGRWTEA